MVGIGARRRIAADARFVYGDRWESRKVRLGILNSMSILRTHSKTNERSHRKHTVNVRQPDRARFLVHRKYFHFLKYLSEPPRTQHSLSLGLGHPSAQRMKLTRGRLHVRCQRA